MFLRARMSQEFWFVFDVQREGLFDAIQRWIHVVESHNYAEYKVREEIE